MPNGPLVVKGEFKILDEQGNEIKKMRIASFCRCGQSNNMPFCDGMHRKIGWVSR
ncbi:MAG: CDGSH iron-sulfur domain-containing protein [Bacteroidales bacterium]|nr:CDGSH iron-sulfur domain-containing protein [Bacteroidales bacterium]MBN2819146.1 CDGSH iron-sulfur domain-containing protein [Bacteroidales bacterium]